VTAAGFAGKRCPASLRLMREHGLLAPGQQPQPVEPK
jgi:hypothetical protein